MLTEPSDEIAGPSIAEALRVLRGELRVEHLGLAVVPRVADEAPAGDVVVRPANDVA